jgi:hypothetical protein
MLLHQHLALLSEVVRSRLYDGLEFPLGLFDEPPVVVDFPLIETCP